MLPTPLGRIQLSGFSTNSLPSGKKTKQQQTKNSHKKVTGGTVAESGSQAGPRLPPHEAANRLLRTYSWKGRGFRGQKTNLTSLAQVGGGCHEPTEGHTLLGRTSGSAPIKGRQPGPRQGWQGKRCRGPAGTCGARAQQPERWKLPRPFLDLPPKGQAATCPLYSGARSPEPGAGVKSGTARITRWRRRARGGESAPSPSRVAPAPAGRRPEGRPAHTGPARGTPAPRRNHGFARRPQSGADAEAILCSGAGPGRGARRWLPRAPVPRRPPKSSRPRPLAALSTPRRAGSGGDPAAAAAPCPYPAPQ